MTGDENSKLDAFFKELYGLSYGDLREIAARLAPHVVEKFCNRPVSREDERELMDVLYDCSEEWVYAAKEADGPAGGRVLEMRNYD